MSEQNETAPLSEEKVKFKNFDFATMVSKSLQSFQRHGYFCDVEILIPIIDDDNQPESGVSSNNVINAHSCVLASNSEFFESLLLRDDLQSEAKKKIILNDVDFKCIEACIDFIYGHDVIVDKEELSTLKTTAEVLRITALADQCQAAISILNSGEDYSLNDDYEEDSGQIAIKTEDDDMDEYENNSLAVAEDYDSSEYSAETGAVKTEKDGELKKPNFPRLHTAKPGFKIRKLIIKSRDGKEDASGDELEKARRNKMMSPAERKQMYRLKSKQPTVCKHCGETFRSYSAMRTHMKKVEGHAEYCQYCGKAFLTKSLLKVHEKRHTQEKNFKCDLCDFRAVTKVEISFHRPKHFANKPAVCEHCGAQYKSEKVLDFHRKKMHSDLAFRFQCPHCDYHAPLKSQLKRHMICHDDSMSYSCQICHKSYKRRPHLARHLMQCHNIHLPRARPHSIHTEIDEKISSAENPQYQTYTTTTNSPTITAEVGGEQVSYYKIETVAKEETQGQEGENYENQATTIIIDTPEAMDLIQAAQYVKTELLQ